MSSILIWIAAKAVLQLQLESNTSLKSDNYKPKDNLRSVYTQAVVTVFNAVIWRVRSAEMQALSKLRHPIRGMTEVVSFCPFINRPGRVLPMVRWNCQVMPACTPHPITWLKPGVL